MARAGRPETSTACATESLTLSRLRDDRNSSVQIVLRHDMSDGRGGPSRTNSQRVSSVPERERVG